MKKNRITIKDIAKELNVSASTVSRALQNHPSLKKETKEMIQALADRWNYQPNSLAQDLLRQTSKIIVVIVPEITGYFFSATLTGIQDILVPTEYNLMVCISNESYEEEARIIQKISKIQLAGVLVVPSSKTKNYDHFRRLQNTGVPLVIFDRDCKDLQAHKVLVDDYSGALAAVDYLIVIGCKKIAHVTGPTGLSTTNHRLRGYIDALKKNNQEVIDEFIVKAKGFTYKDGIQPVKKLLKSDNPPDAIFAVNDRLAIAAIRTATKLNFKVPEDISVVGFDDEPHSSYFTPALTSVRQPVYGIGMLSARILLQSIENKNLEFRHEVFKTELIIRGSSKPLKTNKLTH